jgi:hypothetical protein
MSFSAACEVRTYPTAVSLQLVSPCSSFSEFSAAG